MTYLSPDLPAVKEGIFLKVPVGPTAPDRDSYSSTSSNGDREVVRSTEKAALSALKKFGIVGLLAITAGSITVAISIHLLPVVIVASIVAFAALMGASYIAAPNITRASLVEFGVFWLTAATYAFKTSWGNPTSRKETDENPIVLVHGLAHNSSGFLYLKRRLQKSFPNRPIYAVDLSTSHSIPDCSKELKEFIDKNVRRYHGEKPITLIGHSMGGVVGAHYAAPLYDTVPCLEGGEHKVPKLDTVHNPDYVQMVITLGSPMRGTKMARLVSCAPSVKQMVDGSDYIKNLQERIATIKTKFFHMGSESDIVIRPTPSAMPEANFFNIRRDRERFFADMGHLSLLWSSRIADLIIHELRQQQPATEP